MYGDKCCYAHGEHQLMKKQNAKIGQLPKAWLRDDEIKNMESRGVNPNLRTDRPAPPMSLEQGRIEARRAMQKHVQEQSAPLPPGNTEEDRATREAFLNYDKDKPAPSWITGISLPGGGGDIPPLVVGQHRGLGTSVGGRKRKSKKRKSLKSKSKRRSKKRTLRKKR